MGLNNKIVYLDGDLTLYHNPTLHSTIMDICNVLELDDEEKIKVINQLLIKTYDYSFLSMAKDMANMTGRDINDFLSEKDLRDLEKAHYNEIDGFELYEDSIDFIKELKGIGIKTALASNATDFYRLISRKKFNLDKILHYVYLTCELGYAKNGKIFYEKIMNDSGVLSSQATMVGDNIKADIIAAKDAGLDAIHILREGDSYKKDKFSNNLLTSNVGEKEYTYNKVNDLYQVLQIIKDKK